MRAWPLLVMPSEQRWYRHGDQDFQYGRRVARSGGGGFGSQHVQGVGPGRLAAVSPGQGDDIDAGDVEPGDAW
jgi:hypothetical protein